MTWDCIFTVTYFAIRTNVMFKVQVFHYTDMKTNYISTSIEPFLFSFLQAVLAYDFISRCNTIHFPKLVFHLLSNPTFTCDKMLS